MSRKRDPPTPVQFDPWTSPWEAALADPDALAITRWGAAFEVTLLRAEVDAGNGLAILKSVALCAAHGLLMPDWLCGAFLDRYRRVAAFEVESWDLAFGSPKTKGHLAKKQKHAQFHWPVIQRVVELLNADRSRGVDKALFEDVAESLGNLPGLKGTVCMEIYFEAKKLYRMDPAKIRKIAVLRARR